MVAGHLPWDERPPKKTRKKGKVTVDGPRRRNTRCTLCEKLFDQRDMQDYICQWCHHDVRLTLDRTS